MPHYQPDIAALGAGLEARTPDAAFGILMRLTEFSDSVDDFVPALDRFNNQFFADRGRRALDAICESVARLCANGPRIREKI